MRRELLKMDGTELPKSPMPFCPKCENFDFERNPETGKYLCKTCDAEWSEVYVLAQFPDVTSYFCEEEEIGYPSFNSEDNGARYVSEYEYILHYHKSPQPNQYYHPVAWPESQQYMEILPESIAALCEPIIADEKALADFGSSAIWVPLCIINKTK